MWTYKLKEKVIEEKIHISKYCDKCSALLENKGYESSYQWTLLLREWWLSYGDSEIENHSLDLCEECFNLAIKLLEDNDFTFNGKDVEIKDEI